ncbi:MAG: DNA-processing protein DprA [Kofleriaceae bacterium]
MGHLLLAPGAAGVPRRLAGTAHARAALHVRGTLVERARAVALVGSRGASADGQARAHALAAGLAAAGVLVVSGGALGIDGAAHRGALDAGGATVVVLGTGIDVDYPARHRRLFAEIVASPVGAIVSALPPGTEPRGHQFIARNRLIAALADVVIVVEAQARSGALHTAAAARALGRAVAAVPGSPGADGLLDGGAALVEGAADVDRIFAGAGRCRVLAPAPAEAHALLAAVPAGGIAVEDLAVALGAGLRPLQRLLGELAATGHVRVDAGSHVTLTGLARAARGSTTG